MILTSIPPRVIIPANSFHWNQISSIPIDQIATDWLTVKPLGKMRTLTSLTGPISLSRFWGSTGTAENISLWSAPILCWRRTQFVSSLETSIKRNLMTLRTASIIISILFFRAVSQAASNSSLVPHRVATVPFWENSPRSHCHTVLSERRQIDKTLWPNHMHHNLVHLVSQPCSVVEARPGRLQICYSEYLIRFQDVSTSSYPRVHCPMWRIVSSQLNHHH